MGAGINTVPRVGLLRFTPQPKDAEDFPVGTRVRTPLGMEAVVIAHRGKRRGHRVWLVCRYANPRNRAFDVVLVLPELVVVFFERRKEGGDGSPTIEAGSSLCAGPA